MHVMVFYCKSYRFLQVDHSDRGRGKEIFKFRRPKVPVLQWQPVEQETQHYLTSASHLGIQDGSVRGELLAASASCLPSPSELTDCCRTDRTQLNCSLWSTLSLFGRRIWQALSFAIAVGGNRQLMWHCVLCCRICQTSFPQHNVDPWEVRDRIVI